MVLYCASKKEKKNSHSANGFLQCSGAQGEKSFSESQKKPQRNWCADRLWLTAGNAAAEERKSEKPGINHGTSIKQSAECSRHKLGLLWGRGLESDDPFGVPIILIGLIY